MSKVAKISEPVGFGKSSLTGHRPIRNIEADVRAVQTMLKEVPADKGGTPGLAVNGKISGPNDPTVAAINKFQQKAFGFHDGVVDPTSKTETALRALVGADGPPAPTPPPPPKPPTKTKLDVIIKFVGTIRKGTRFLSEDEVFPDVLLETYRQKPDRKLIRFGQTTITIRQDSKELISQALIFVKAELSTREIGKVFVYGSSSGGRNALDMAVALTDAKIPVSLVALLDAAFFPNEATNVPDAVPKPTNVPRFNLSGALSADDQLSFFQKLGNKSEESFLHGNLFSSTMAGKEVHGIPFGFSPKDLTTQVSGTDLRPQNNFNADEMAHVSLIKVATPIVHDLIRSRLDAL